MFEGDENTLYFLNSGALVERGFSFINKNKSEPFTDFAY